MAEARGRGLELVPPLRHRQSYKKRTESAWESVQQRAPAGHGPEAHEAFAPGVLPVAWTRGRAQSKQPGGRELACARPLQWPGQGQRVEAGATGRRRDHPDRLRSVRVRCRHGDTQQGWGWTQVVRLQR
jgi:hypothetical protein